MPYNCGCNSVEGGRSPLQAAAAAFASGMNDRSGLGEREDGALPAG